MSEKTDKKPFKENLDLKTKLEILKAIDNGVKQSVLAKKYNLNKATICKINKKASRDKIQAAINSNLNLKSKRIPSCKYQDVEAKTLKYYRDIKLKNIPVTGTILKNYAKSQAAESSDFRASNGWLSSFIHRHNIKFKSVPDDPETLQNPEVSFDDQIPVQSEITESKYKIAGEPVQNLIQWRNWCRLCSSTDDNMDLAPSLHEAFHQISQLNFLDDVKICKTCQGTLSSISKLMEQAKKAEKMFEELEEQEKQDCLTNDSIFSIRKQFMEVEEVFIKMEPQDDDDTQSLTDLDVKNPYNSEDISPPKESWKQPSKVTEDENLYDYTCHICQETFQRMFFLSNHTRNEHNCLPQVACTCGRLLATWDSLMKHKRKHENQGEWICDICGSKNLTKLGLSQHIKFKHLRVKSRRLCTICGKDFKCAFTLKQHERSHLPDEEKRIYECPQCSKKFFTKASMLSHAYLHTGEKKIICHICSKAFATKQYLKEHLGTHKIENLACSYCDGIFKNKISLQSHVKKIHNPGHFPCTVCDKVFTLKTYLRNHMISHSDARNWKCTFEGCSSSYKREKDLRTHLSVHTNIKKKCLYCYMEFNDGANLRKHALSNHPVEVAEFERKFGKGRRMQHLLYLQ